MLVATECSRNGESISLQASSLPPLHSMVVSIKCWSFLHYSFKTDPLQKLINLAPCFISRPRFLGCFYYTTKMGRILRQALTLKTQTHSTRNLCFHSSPKDLIKNVLEKGIKDKNALEHLTTCNDFSNLLPRIFLLSLFPPHMLSHVTALTQPSYTDPCAVIHFMKDTE